MGERSPPGLGPWGTKAPGFRGFFKGDPVPESEPGRDPSAEPRFQLMGWPKARRVQDPEIGRIPESKSTPP
jgi:hypothetical protein